VNVPMAAQLPLWRRFLVFLVPMLLSNVLQSLSGTLNSVYLGQMLGVGALAAATTFFPILFFFIAFILGLGTGATVLIGQAWGAGDTGKVKAIAGTTLAVTLAGGMAIAIIGGLFTRELMVLFGTPADILADATAYARVMLITMPALFVFLLVTSLLRGVGDAVTPLWALAISTLSGLLITPALIRGWAGLPAVGIASAAWASAISVTVSLIWLAVRLRRRAHPLAPDAALLRHMRFNGAILRLVLRIGIPTGVQMVTMALAEMVLLGLVNQYGSDATAAYGAFNQVMAYVQFPAMSIAITVSVLGAQAIGAGHVDRLGGITRTGLLYNLVLTGSLVAVTYASSRTIISFFITNASVVELTQKMLHIVLWSTVVFGLAIVFSGMMRASGTVLAPMVISIFAILVVEVPSAWVLSGRLGIEGLWIAYPVAFTAMLVLQSSYYLLVWRKKRILRLA
jgi:putative MATE family efflux protein